MNKKYNTIFFFEIKTKIILFNLGNRLLFCVYLPTYIQTYILVSFGLFLKNLKNQKGILYLFVYNIIIYFILFLTFLVFSIKKSYFYIILYSYKFFLNLSKYIFLVINKINNSYQFLLNKLIIFFISLYFYFIFKPTGIKPNVKVYYYF